MSHIFSAPSAAATLGRALFRWRGVTPVPFFVLMFAMRPDYHPTVPQMAMILAGIVASEGVRLWAVGHAGSATRTRGDSVPELVRAGPFRHVRNPLYLANTFMYTLLGMLLGFAWLSLTVLLFSVVQYALIIRYEERLLAQTFGSEYLAYCARVPRLIPALGARVASSNHRFSLARALVSEKSTVFSMTLMAFAVWVKLR